MEGKSLVVIGGTSGIGLSGAAALVRAGARVVVVGRNAEKVGQAVAELGANARGLSADATDPATAPRAIDMAREAFGAMHGLYHVAGGSGRSEGDGPLHDLTDRGLEFTLQLNLHSLIYSNRAAVRHFRREGSGGVILNTASVLGFSPSPEFFSTHAYAAAKAAIIGFSKSIAAYYAREDIRVNVLAPGLVETPMARRAAQDQEILRFIRAKQPLDGGRIGLPTDLDAAVVLLLSGAASFITGQVLAIDGGWTVS